MNAVQDKDFQNEELRGLPREKRRSGSGETLVRLRGVKKHYPVKGGFFRRSVEFVRAVDGVDLDILSGETLGLVGESGCGKSTLGKLIIRLEEATSGTIEFAGLDLRQLDVKGMRARRRDMQVIFQDPYSSLNFRRTVGQTIEEPFIIHGIPLGREERRERVLKLMEEVGLRPEQIDRYPHEFSGGQRQRIGIARAVALKPRLIICDEPVSALDVSIQGQVINLLQDLQEKYRLTYLFIAHDLSVVRHISTRVAVMYLGRIVEIASNDQLYEKPLHPYTEALISASPVPSPKAKRERIVLEGDVPSPMDPPSGCHFHPRCPRAFQACRERVPELAEIDRGHAVRCLLYERK
ncbi:MAG TPA: dipeptide ABC transporter ATP-binding protein [Thermodesulfobacteriota bacterium]|nr:dipeptide ABC transporter ATP-binding protein [Thermodesulfobacteriota bacterium]